jgi:hypothetical protein
MTIGAIKDFADKYFLEGGKGWTFLEDIFNESVLCDKASNGDKKEMAINNVEMAVEKAFIGFQDT